MRRKGSRGETSRGETSRGSATLASGVQAQVHGLVGDERSNVKACNSCRRRRRRNFGFRWRSGFAIQLREASEVLKFGCVCKSWREISRDPFLWRGLIKARWPNIASIDGLLNMRTPRCDHSQRHPSLSTRCPLHTFLFQPFSIWLLSGTTSSCRDLDSED